MKYEKLCKPCKNFMALSIINIIDPKDNQEKIAFVSVSQAAVGMLVIADYEKEEYESYSMPMDAGAWGLLQLPSDKSILLGTSHYFGSLQRFDMMKREWYTPLRIESEEYIWNLVLGSDGNVYGGTWPGDKLVQYCPDTHQLNDIGKVSAEEGNNYARLVYAEIQGKIFISSQFDTNRVTEFNFETNSYNRDFTKRPCSVLVITDNCVCTSDEDTVEFLDPQTGKRLIEEEIKLKDWENYAEKYEIVKEAVEKYNHNSQNVLKSIYGHHFFAVSTYMSNGDIIGIQGQEIFKIKKGELQVSYKDINCEAPETMIHQLIAGDDGKLWGTTSFGLTLFNYDPKTGEFNNTKSITTGGGDIFGMVSHKGKIYCTTYSWGEHVVYDPSKPWQCRENINPQVVNMVYPKYIRPYTRSHIDNDEIIWTGWLSEYGTREMAISKWDTKTNTVELFEKIVPNTGVFGMAVTDKYVWFTTCNYANGLPDLDVPLSLCAIDKTGNLIFQKSFGQNENVGRIAFCGNYGIVQVGTRLYQIDEENLKVKLMDNITLNLYDGCRLQTMTNYNEDTVIVFDIDYAIFVKPQTGEVVNRIESPKGNPKELFYHGVFVSANLNGEIYASVGTDLYKLVE